MTRAFLRIFVGLAVLLGVVALHVAGQDQPQQEEVVLALVVEAGKVECVYQPMTNPKHVALEVAYQVSYLTFVDNGSPVKASAVFGKILALAGKVP